MPKPVVSTLIWSWERDIYTLCKQGNSDAPLLQGDDEPWFMWLTSHTSFSFQGKYGRLNLQKERRPRGREGYWYAYRRQGKRTVKKYAGRTPDLSIARLEQLAHFLEAPMGDASPAAVSGLVPPTHRVPLLASKLQLPRLPSPFVERPRLLARLDSGRMGKLTLLSAPAGFGKTMLVRQWVDNRTQAGNTHGGFPPLAWLTLDADDNDPLRFWHYLIVACQSLQAGLGQSALSYLGTAQQLLFEPLSLEAMLTTFLNELAHTLPGGMLVLDDYHVITSPRIHETMTFFLDHLPTTLHLLITTRVDPPLPLTYLRTHHDLCELRAGDLRFSPEETYAFLQQTVPFSLSSEVIMQCETLLEGWVTGLHLLALMLQGQATGQEIKHIPETFTGSNQALVEYFVGEVLSAQPRELQRFLLYTSALSRLCGPLCDTITERNDSEQLLAELARANVFLQPLAEPAQVMQWYRYHALFAEAMQHEARHRLGEDVISIVSSRASQWFEQHGMLAEAIEAARQAGDMLHMAGLIERLIGTRHLLEINEFYALRRWVEQIPETLLSQRPLLAFNYALALLFASASDYFVPATLAQLQKMLQMAEEGFRREGNLPRLGEIFTLRALLARKRGALKEAGTWGRQALAWLPAQEQLWQGVSLGIVAEEARYAGWLDLARQTLQEATDIGKLLAHEELQGQAALLQARVEHARMQTDSAQRRCALLVARMQSFNLPLLSNEVLLWQAWLQLTLGNFSAMQRWVSSRDQQNEELPLLHQEREEQLVARWLLAQGKIEESLHQLKSLLQAAQEAGRVRSVLEIQVLMAQAHAARKQRHEAREMLQATLAQAHAEGYVRLFLDEGDALIAILQTLTLREPPLRAYRQILLHSVASARVGKSSGEPSLLVAQLSLQEQKVLRLLAGGLSNPEIAQALVVSVTTIHTQVQSIYRKLGVNNRVAASEMARHLRLP